MEKKIEELLSNHRNKKVVWGFLFSEVHHKVWVERNTEIQN